MKTDLKLLNEESPAPFSNQKIIKYKDYVESRGLYFEESATLELVSIPLNQIIGHSQCYDEMIWGDCLNGHHLNRIENRLEKLKENPHYYLNKEKKYDISIRQIENDYFIAEGKHRVIIARYFAHFNQELFGDKPMLHGVKLIKENIDYEFVRIKEQLESAVSRYPDLNIEVVDKMLDFSEYKIRMYKNGEYRPVIFFRNEMETLLDALYRPSIIKKIQGDKFHRLQSVRSCFIAG